MISVIVPVYNVEKYLRECLDSIRRQTYSDLEIILIDDGSTDSSGDICDSYVQMDQRFKVIHQENKGLSVARNVGLEMACGKYIAFVDSDDVVENTMYEKLILSIEKNNADVAICGFHQFSENVYFPYNPEESLHMTLGSRLVDGFDFFGYINVFRFMVWNKLYRACLIKDRRFIPKQIHQDIHFQNLVMRHCDKISYVNEGLYKYRINRKGSTNTKKFSDKRLCFIEEFANILTFLNENTKKKAYMGFAAYVSRYYFNEMRLACSLRASKQDKSAIAKGYKNIKKHSRGCWPKPDLSVQQKLFDIWPAGYAMLYPIIIKVRGERG